MERCEAFGKLCTLQTCGEAFISRDSKVVALHTQTLRRGDDLGWCKNRLTVQISLADGGMEMRNDMLLEDEKEGV